MLKIKNLKVATQIGVYEWEQKIKQTLLLDLAISGDFAACKDELANTVDYDALCQAVTQFVQSRGFKLIETVAQATADFISHEFKINTFTLTVTKPHAVANAEGVQVIIERG